ncbi:MAG TPA: hypothetical protein ENJ32_05430 [Crenotrichaceae bacterium]|nr:hypothetical protein [Crenotrichaceae bacterium]
MTNHGAAEDSTLLITNDQIITTLLDCKLTKWATPEITLISQSEIAGKSSGTTESTTQSFSSGPS